MLIYRYFVSTSRMGIVRRVSHSIQTRGPADDQGTSVNSHTTPMSDVKSRKSICTKIPERTRRRVSPLSTTVSSRLIIRRYEGLG